jgi:hypothetical protein
MLKFLSALFLLLLFQLSFSQNEADEEVDYEYAEGYYVDISGIKHEGQILIKSNKILFYASDSEEKKKIKLTTIDTLVLNGKRFLVIKKMKLKAEMGINSDYFRTLITEELLVGKIKLYRTYAVTSMQSGLNMELIPGAIETVNQTFDLPQEGNYAPKKTTSSYTITKADRVNVTHNPLQTKQESYGEEFYIIQKGKGEYVQVKTGNKKFRKLITSLTQDNKEAFKEINIQEKDYYNLIEIINIYNSK